MRQFLIYRKWIERGEIKRKLGNVESEALSISSFSRHFLFIFLFSLHFHAAWLPGCHNLCNPAYIYWTWFTSLPWTGDQHQAEDHVAGVGGRWFEWKLWVIISDNQCCGWPIIFIWWSYHFTFVLNYLNHHDQCCGWPIIRDLCALGRRRPASCSWCQDLPSISMHIALVSSPSPSSSSSSSSSPSSVLHLLMPFMAWNFSFATKNHRYNMDSLVSASGIIQASSARNTLTGEKCVACFSPKWSSFLSRPLSGLLHKMQLRHWQVFKSGEKCLISCLVLVPLSFTKTSQGESSYVRLLSIWTSTAMWLI